MSDEAIRVLKRFRDLKGRYAVTVERVVDGARCLGHSWLNYESAEHDGATYLSHLPVRGTVVASDSAAAGGPKKEGGQA